MTLLGLTNPSQRANTAEPLFRQHAIGSIIKPHHLVPAAQGPEQLGQARRGVPVLYLTVQLEPINATRNFDAECAWTSKDLSFGFDVPACLHKRAHDARQLARRQLPPRRRIRVGGSALLQAKLIEKRAGGLLLIGIPAYKTPSCSIEKASRRIERREHAALVRKRQFRIQAFMPVPDPGFGNCQMRMGWQHDLLVSELLWHPQWRQARTAEQSRQEFIALLFGNRDRAPFAKSDDPFDRGIASERCHTVSRDYQTCRGQGRECCFPALFSTLEKAGEGTCCFANPVKLKEEIPGTSFVPRKRKQAVRFVQRPQEATSRAHHQGHEHA